jgi:hypothetical protein
MARRSRRATATATATAIAALIAVTALSGCSDSDKPDGFSELTERDGRTTGFEVGDATIPADFPSAQVPLPEAGPLLAAVREGQSKIRFFNLTFGMGGRNANTVGAEYSERLEKAGFDIKDFSRTRNSDYVLTQFNALGDDWDVAVVSGKTTRNEPQQLSVQVSTHGSIVQDLEELDILDNGTGEVNIDPGTSSTSSPTTPGG